MLNSLRTLLHDEERAASVLIWGLCGIGAAAFMAAVLAMAVLR